MFPIVIRITVALCIMYEDLGEALSVLWLVHLDLSELVSSYGGLREKHFSLPCMQDFHPPGISTCIPRSSGVPAHKISCPTSAELSHLCFWQLEKCKDWPYNLF